jgi:hypothetical protein
MAIKEVTLPPCKDEIFRQGKGVCVIDGDPEPIERWVRAVANKAKAKVDWHYSGGRANVLHLGDQESRQRVLNTISELKPELEGRLLSIDGPALYRDGVEDPKAVGAVVRKVGGKLVLDDPEAVGMVMAVAKISCQKTLQLNIDRVTHFKHRFAERKLQADESVIVVLNADDVHGNELAAVLMPDQNWQEIRDRGEVPFARGLAGRAFMQAALNAFDADAATKLLNMKQLAVVVVDHGVAEVFAA